MFEMYRERQSYPTVHRDERGEWVPTEAWVDAEVMEHESGFQLIRLGVIPPLKNTRFRYVKRNISFDFYADRRHWRGGTVTGTYSIVADFKPGQMLGIDPWPVERAKMEMIAADINVGLRAWLPEHFDEARPIGVVHFYFFTFSSPPRTDYRFSLGEPIALREVPPSRRWVLHTIRHCVGRNSDGAEKLQNCVSLLRDDGVQIIRIPTMRGPADDGPDTYHYAEKDVAFDFTAERRLTMLIVTDTWEVQLDPPRRDGLSAAKRADLGAARCVEIVRSIEEALYAWPAKPHETQEQQVPVNRVVFLDAPQGDIAR